MSKVSSCVKRGASTTGLSSPPTRIKREGSRFYVKIGSSETDSYSKEIVNSNRHIEDRADVMREFGRESASEAMNQKNVMYLTRDRAQSLSPFTLFGVPEGKNTLSNYNLRFKQRSTKINSNPNNLSVGRNDEVSRRSNNLPDTVPRPTDLFSLEQTKRRGIKILPRL